jgi:hypothetical protein
MSSTSQKDLSRAENKSVKPDKKPFDKKKWRDNKYNLKHKGILVLLFRQCGL